MVWPFVPGVFVKEGEVVFPLLSHGFHLKTLHALSMWLLNGMGLFGAAGLCLPDCSRAAVLYLCYDGSTVGLGLLDAGGVLSFCFTNKHDPVGLSFLVVWAQRVLASLMASVVSDSFWQRAISKSKTCFLQWASREDLVTNRHPNALSASFWSWTTSPERTPVSSPEVLTGREISSRVGSSGSASSGMLTCRDTWEEVSTGLMELSSMRGDGAPKASDSGLLEVEHPNAWLEVSRATCDRIHWPPWWCWLHSPPWGRHHSRACGRSGCWATTEKWSLGLMSIHCELQDVHL